MFTLQKLNVVRIVATEREKAELIGQGFKEIVKKTEEKIETEVKKIDKRGKDK